MYEREASERKACLGAQTSEALGHKRGSPDRASRY